MFRFLLFVLLTVFNINILYAQAKNTAQSNPPKNTISTGTFLLKTDLKKGQVFLNQQLISSLPFPGPWTLNPGQYEIEIANEKGNRKKQSFSIQANQQTELKLELGNKQVVKENIKAPKEKEEYIHIGAGFSLVKASYIIGSIGILAAGYGTFAHFSSQDAIDQANALDKSKHIRSEQNQLVYDAESSAFNAKLALASGSIAIISAITMLFWSKDSILSAAPSSNTQANPLSTKIFSTGNGLGLGATF